MLKPMNKYLLVEEAEPERTESGLSLATVQSGLVRGRVVAASDELMDYDYRELTHGDVTKTEEVVTPRYSPGDLVVYHVTGAEEYRDAELRKYFLVQEKEIRAKYVK